MAKIPNGGVSTQKVKLMCSYGGRIHPRSQDQKLSYVSGETKILTVDRQIKLPDIVSKLQAVCNFKGDAICIKYQLPGEDLDVLVSLINEEDLENMMFEYDLLQMNISPEKPVRFRLFLASINTNDEAKHGLNSGSDSAGNPDYLFGLDKDYGCGKANNNDCPPTNPQAPGFDLGLWSIPRTAITANSCSVNLNESEKQDSHDVHVAANGVVQAPPMALLYNVPVPAQNGGYQTASRYGVGRMMPMHCVNGYRDQPLYFMAPSSVHSAPEQQRKIPVPAACMGSCCDGKVVNNQVRNM